MEVFEMEQKDIDRLAQERVRIQKAREETKMLVDPTIEVQFNNLEDPPAPGRPSPPLSFVFNGYRFKESRTPEDGEDTALRDGGVYRLPMSVVEHLNSIQVPVYQQTTVRDEVTGAAKIVTIIVGYTRRFSCVPKDMGSFAVTNEPPQAEIRRGNPGTGHAPKQDQQSALEQKNIMLRKELDEMKTVIEQVLSDQKEKSKSKGGRPKGSGKKTDDEKTGGPADETGDEKTDDAGKDKS
jgi:hypothetical protein